MHSHFTQILNSFKKTATQMNKNLIYRKLCYETYNKIPKIPKSHRCDLANETKLNKS